MPDNRHTRQVPSRKVPDPLRRPFHAVGIHVADGGDLRISRRRDRLQQRVSAAAQPDHSQPDLFHLCPPLCLFRHPPAIKTGPPSSPSEPDLLRGTARKAAFFRHETHVMRHQAVPQRCPRDRFAAPFQIFAEIAIQQQIAAAVHAEIGVALREIAREVQPSKAYSPIVVTPSGMTTDVNELHS